MGSGTGGYFAKLLLNQIFGGTAYTWANLASIDLGLFSTVGANAGGNTELASSNGYARYAMPQSTSTWPAATGTGNGSISNGAVIPPGTQWTATGTWATVVSLSMFEHGNSNLVLWGDLTTSKTLSAGDQLIFPIGNLVITQS